MHYCGIIKGMEMPKAVLVADVIAYHEELDKAAVPKKPLELKPDLMAKMNKDDRLLYLMLHQQHTQALAMNVYLNTGPQRPYSVPPDSNEAD